ncbi:MAG: IS66 family transposase [Isosphaeraceae bacterium]|nr:IS66 family transposase [Isosphaeraceae bacterium]
MASGPTGRAGGPPRRDRSPRTTHRRAEARLGQDSSNSSKPPSSDPIHVKRHPPRPPSGKRRGGQRGHRRQARALVPPEQLSAVIDCKPAACGSCSQELKGSDPEPIRHQVAELPEIRPEVIEYRLHRLACRRCGATTRGGLPAGVPRGAFGPRLQAVVGLLGGAYRLSKRQIQAILADLLGLTVSTGMVCKTERQAAEAIAAPVEEVYQHVRDAAVAGVDETGWGVQKLGAWVWAAVTAQATAFRIHRSRGADALATLVGEPVGPVIISDRFPTCARAPNRQICWAPLRRDFQAMIDRAAGGEAVGAKLLHFSGFVFAWWKRSEAGSVQRLTLRAYVAGLKPVVRSLLECGAACSCPGTAKVCRKLRSAEPALWTFAAVEGVPPHHNATERALRHGVIWRKSSYGTDSEVGSRFVERLLTVVATCRQRGRDVLGYLTACLRAQLGGSLAPALLA